MVKKKKEQKWVYFQPIKVESTLDFGRLAYSSSQDSRNLFLLKLKEVKALCVLGEFIGDTRMLYYTPMEKSGSYAVYSPKDEHEDEIFEITDALSQYTKIGVARMPIIAIEGSVFKEKELKKDSILYVRAQNHRDIINAIINGNLNSDGMGMVYRFTYSGKAYIGSFEIITDDKKVFVYAEDKDASPNNAFYAYDYSSNTTFKAKGISENSYIYVRIINLAAPMPYFKD
jgi:hypothetical protein